jgi:hypothetical protein
VDRAGTSFQTDLRVATLTRVRRASAPMPQLARVAGVAVVARAGTRGTATRLLRTVERQESPKPWQVCVCVCVRVCVRVRVRPCVLSVVHPFARARETAEWQRIYSHLTTAP